MGAPAWSNETLFEMAMDLRGQIMEIKDDAPMANERRAALATAAAHLDLAWAQLERMSGLARYGKMVDRAEKALGPEPALFGELLRLKKPS